MFIIIVVTYEGLTNRGRVNQLRVELSVGSSGAPTAFRSIHGILRQTIPEGRPEEVALPK